MTTLLGYTVRDKVTNLQGVATSYHQSLHRMPQYGVQPVGDGKSIPDAMCVDEGDLELVEGIDRAAFTPAPSFEIGLDQLVKDTVTGLVGKTMNLTTYKDGCVSFLVLPNKLDNNGKYPDALMFAVQRLELVPVRTGLLSRAKPEEAKQPPAKPPGGPRLSMSAFRRA